MKKVVLTVVAVMTMTFGFAETRNHSVTASNVAVNAEKYDMSCDMRRLAVTLDLTSEQMEAVQVIQDNFNDAVLAAGTAQWGHERRAKVHEAVRTDLHRMHRVLNDKQFRTYMLLLGTTLRNKGL